MPALSQIISATYPDILADMRKPHNQWAESAFLRAMEKFKFIERSKGGESIEYPLDSIKNAGTDFLATDFTATAVTKTDVLAGAKYAWASLVSPINVSMTDEAMNSDTDMQKVALVKSLVTNAVNSHDDEIELRIFGTIEDGFLGLDNLVPTSGQPNVGGIDGATVAYWRNHADTYAADGSDIAAVLTEAYNTVAKGTGSPLSPKLLVSGGAAQSLYEGELQTQQRWSTGDEASGGFEGLAFKNAVWVFSHRGGTKIYMLNPKSFNMVVRRGYFRKLSGAQRFTNAAASNQQIFSLVQAAVNNPSRLAVLSQV